MSNITNYYTFPPLSGNTPQQMVMLLHGFGADGRDLIELAPAFADILPDAVFICPDAPQRCEMSPLGFQWFSLQNWSGEMMLAGVKAAFPPLDSFITEQLKKYDLTDDKLVLGGFSQGCMMSLYAALRRDKQIAGVLGYSGGLVWEADMNAATLPKPPIHLVHGDADTVVPLAFYIDAKERLESAGFTVSGGVVRGLPHSIDDQGIAGGREFLRRVFA
jgi:phospholipase/carboxylesterase